VRAGVQGRRHELLGDGIVSAIDLSVEISRAEGAGGAARVVPTLDGKWLRYKKV